MFSVSGMPDFTGVSEAIFALGDIFIVEVENEGYFGNKSG